MWSGVERLGKFRISKVRWNQNHLLDTQHTHIPQVTDSTWYRNVSGTEKCKIWQFNSMFQGANSGEVVRGKERVGVWGGVGGQERQL